MSAATSDRPTTRRAGTTRFGLLAAAAIVFAGTMICREDADGELVDGSDTSGVRFAGIAREGVDNTNDGEGVNFYVDGEFLLDGSGFTEDDIGKPVYLVDNQTVGAFDAVTNPIKVGILAGIESSGKVWVRIEPDERHAREEYTVLVAGPNADDVDLSGAAGAYGGSDFYVKAVNTVEAIVAATGAHDGLRASPADYTVAGGTITTTGDESANLLKITFIGALV